MTTNQWANSFANELELKTDYAIHAARQIRTLLHERVAKLNYQFSGHEVSHLKLKEDDNLLNNQTFIQGPDEQIASLIQISSRFRKCTVRFNEAPGRISFTFFSNAESISEDEDRTKLVVAQAIEDGQGVSFGEGNTKSPAELANWLIEQLYEI